MTLKTLIARLRASLGFGRFRTGGTVLQTEAEKLTAQMARVRRTIPPEHLRRAEAKASAELNRIREEIKRQQRADLGLLDENYMDQEDLERQRQGL